MAWDVPDVADEFRIFRQRMDLFFEDQDVVAPEKRALKLKIAIGGEGLRRIEQSGLSEADKKDPDMIYELFERQLHLKVNFRIHRLELMRFSQKPAEDIDTFVRRCRHKAGDCDFTAAELAERIVELVIASTPNEHFQRDLLSREKGYTLDNLVAEGRRYEAMDAGRQCLQSMDRSQPVREVGEIKKRKPCGNCGTVHKYRNCPAYKDTCSACGSKGHWQKFCRNTQKSISKGEDQQSQRYKSKYRGADKGHHRDKPQKKTVHCVNYPEEDFDDDFNHLEINTIQVSTISSMDTDSRDEAFTSISAKFETTKLIVDFRVKVDTGAQGNTLPIRMYRRMCPQNLAPDGFPIPNSVHSRNTILSAYNGTTITHYGAVKFPCRYKHGQWMDTEFYIVESEGPAILGLPTSRDMRLITLHCAIDSRQSVYTSTEQVKSDYPDCFDAIGRFSGEYHIVIDPGVQPTIHASRKFPINLKDELRSELDKMEEQGVIRRVSEPTDWVSSIVVTRKNNGSLRICIDTKDLNNAIKRCHHKTPTIEEVTHKLSGAKYLSKFDAKSGYWAVVLDEESSLLTTFNTPFGRYCYKRMPFGLVMSQDVFQNKMDQILECCTGTVSIADDVIVHGRTEQEHDDNLRNLMETSRKHGLVFNSSKCTVRAPQITFFGAVYDQDGTHPDPDKVASIKCIPSPTSKTQLQEFLGMVTYMSSFIPRLSDLTADLRALLKQDVDFIWTASHEAAFQKVKDSVCTNVSLAYYDTTKSTTIQVDASLKGLGAALIQDGRPVAFASKSLSETEGRYANIEREMLAVVFGCERFHTYIYGQPFMVESDHKPLEMIQLKSLSAAPPRLQRMLLRLQNYNVHIKYKPGSQMLLADGLSRLPSPNNTHIDLDINIHFAQFTTEKVSETRRATTADPVMTALQQTITKGWPDRMKQLRSELRPYWAYRDELSVSDGIVMKGESIVIPKSMQQAMMARIHEGHQGIEKCRLRAKHVVYWPSLQQDIINTVGSCQTCQTYQRSNTREPLISHEIPTSPWQVVGTDLFQLDGVQYLIITDYKSKFPFIRKMPLQCTSSAVITASKQIFSEHGIPKTVVSDNGPHYSSAEYAQFASDWEFEHTTSSPHYPQSNGHVERSIQTVKRTMRKAKASGADIHKALLCLRTTPIDDHIPSPAQMLYNRRVRDSMPFSAQDDTPDRTCRLLDKQNKQKKHYDRRATLLPSLRQGQHITWQDQATGKWAPATVLKKDPQPRSYHIQTPNGSVFRRNRKHLRTMPMPSMTSMDAETVSNANPQAIVDNVPCVRPHVSLPQRDNRHVDNYHTRSGRVVHVPDKMNL